MCKIKEYPLRYFILSIADTNASNIELVNLFCSSQCWCGKF